MIPIIETFKKHGGYLNENDIIKLPADTPFGNLTLKWLDIMQRFDEINDKIIEINSIFKQMQDNRTQEFNPSRQVGITKAFSKQKCLIEELVYWLRKSTDEFVALIYVLEGFKKSGKYPSKIKIDSIGKLLKYKNLKDSFFSKFYYLFEGLNDISNSYKHSFINTDGQNYIGNESPHAFALRLDYNDLRKDAIFYTIDLTELINEYIEFSKNYKEEVIKYYA